MMALPIQGKYRVVRMYIYIVYRIADILKDKLTKEAGLKLVPWGGVAANLTQPLASTEGQAFCFLPLPAHTGCNTLLYILY